MRNIGVYIHIPFCKQKCLYCDFMSFWGKEHLVQRYMNALKQEIHNWLEANDDTKIDTIYIGGGTPSYIESNYIVDLIQMLENRLSKNAEITIEVNSGTVTKQKLLDYKKAGINRLSIGLQSTSNKLLKQIGRIHTFKDFLVTYETAQDVGFSNINIDLMIGLPNQRIKDIKKDLEVITNLEPNHVSVYSLIVEDNTAIKDLIEKGKLKLPDEELERNMYWYVKDYLELCGYKHYEISNFCKEGFASKHNMDCWNQKEYIGFGLNASSYIDRKRFRNIQNLEDYINNIEKGDFERNIVLEEVQEKQEQMKEYMLLGLRKTRGVSIQCFENKFNENPIMFFKESLDKLCSENLLIIDGDYIRLTNNGLNFANIVWEEFI